MNSSEEAHKSLAVNETLVFFQTVQYSYHKHSGSLRSSIPRKL